jgi:hypothetical protein
MVAIFKFVQEKIQNEKIKISLRESVLDFLQFSIYFFRLLQNGGKKWNLRYKKFSNATQETKYGTAAKKMMTAENFHIM